ncbi:MAG: gamma-glutamyltransferase [Candidatus Lambdaproteobacteria bacterium]|nr:gamma-glutamyltransferase [Candidatus Lambdaproteobacteria bacterium]
MRDFQFPGRSVVMGTRGMIASSQPMAAQVGLDVLQHGGNALDAAVAAMATHCVVEPGSTGLGGDCFILYHEAKTGRLHGLNGSGRAPARATVEEYRRRGHRTGHDSKAPERGALSVTVPGAVDAWETALTQYGTKGLDDLLQPAIRFAEEGYAVSPVIARGWAGAAELLAAHPDSRRALTLDGKAPAAGTIHRQPELGRSLRRIAREGKAAFYQGAIAQEIARFMEQEQGLITLDDLAAHRSEWVAPVETTYRGIRLCELPPNAQGIVALMTLNILERSGIERMARLGADHVHTFAEAFKLALAERDRWVADAAFHPAPLETLLDKGYAERQRARIDPTRALSHPVASGLTLGSNTVYLSVVDRDRNCCSFINSLGMGFGSGLVAGNTGITLQNRGYAFVLEEGHPNVIAPHKRPMHTLVPAMAYRGDRPILCFGVMGRHYQPLGHAYVVSNWLDFGLDIQEAVDAPRFMALHGKLDLERGIPPATREALARRGHAVAEARSPPGGAQVILIDHEQGVLQGASDPRKDGCALGY